MTFFVVLRHRFQADFHVVSRMSCFFATSIVKTDTKNLLNFLFYYFLKSLMHKLKNVLSTASFFFLVRGLFASFQVEILKVEIQKYLSQGMTFNFLRMIQNI